MRVWIGMLLLTLGFLWGVVYDQNIAVLPLQKELQVERGRNDILKDALRRLRPNKHTMSDAIYDAMKRWEHQ